MFSPRRPGAPAMCAVVAGLAVWSGAWAGGRAAVGEELRCVFEVTRETVVVPALNVGVGDPARTGRPRTLPKEKEAFRLVVGLAKDTLVCEDPDVAPEVVAYHFPSRRVTELDLKQKTYRDLSLYAVVAFRVNESINRFALAATFARLPGGNGRNIAAGAAAGVGADPDPAPPDPNLIRCINRFAVETLFSIRLKSAPPAPAGAVFLARPVIKVVPGPAGKGWHFLHDNDLAVEFIPSDRPLPPDCRASLRHFLAYRCAIHPEIRDKILDSGMLPERLSYRSFEFRERTDQTVTLRLASATLGPTRWQGPPADFTPAHDAGDLLDQVLQKIHGVRPARPPGSGNPAMAMATAARGGRNALAAPPRAPAKSALEAQELPADRPALVRFVTAALKQGRALDAHLGWCEYAARTGDPAGDVGETIRNAARPTTTLVSPHLAPTPEGAERQLRDLDAIDRKGLTRGYMVDALAGTILAALRRTDEAEARWLKALDANPRLVGVLVQLGSNRFHAFSMTDAWRCFDAARHVDPGSPLLADISRLESRFEADFPDEF
jgi:hypothetical protein